MAHSCNVESCTRFTVTQWIVSIGMTLIMLIQAYTIGRIDKNEEGIANVEKTFQNGVEEIKDSVSILDTSIKINQTVTKNNTERISNLEDDLDKIIISKIGP